MKFYKMSATQNTFFFIEESKLIEKNHNFSLEVNDRRTLARTLCSEYGTKADGLVIVKIKENGACDYAWDFYNKDGSSAEMCGNASRCMALFVRDYLGFSKSQLVFETEAGVIQVQYLENNIFRVKMPRHEIRSSWEIEKKEGQEIPYCFINTGVPHVVIPTMDFRRDSLLPMAKHFRFKKEFGAAGANVSFFRENQNGNFEGVTFERGVENFTQSCGTGVVSMGLAIFHQYPQLFSHGKDKQVTIQTPGGDLSVELKAGEDFCWLIGPAQLVEIIECLPKAILT